MKYLMISYEQNNELKQMLVEEKLVSKELKVLLDNEEVKTIHIRK